MKTVTLKQLTSNEEINKYLVAKVNLDTKTKHFSSLIEMIHHAFLSGELTKEEVRFILYDIYHVDEEFYNLSNFEIEFLAELGYEHERIVENSENLRALMSIARQYKCLETLTNHRNASVQRYAQRYLNEMNQLISNNCKLLELIHRLDLSKFTLYDLTQKSVRIVCRKMFYDCDYGIDMLIIEDVNSFTLHLGYNIDPIEKCRRVEERLNEYTFKNLINQRDPEKTKKVEIAGLTLEEVLQFVEKELRMNY